MNNWQITPISDEKRHNYQITLCSVAVTQENMEKIFDNVRKIQRLAFIYNATQINSYFSRKDNSITITINFDSLLYFKKFQKTIHIAFL